MFSTDAKRSQTGEHLKKKFVKSIYRTIISEEVHFTKFFIKSFDVPFSAPFFRENDAAILNEDTRAYKTTHCIVETKRDFFNIFSLKKIVCVCVCESLLKPI